MALDPGMAGKHEILHPLLLECDATGKVLWMSLYARQALGDLCHVSELLRLTPACISSGQVQPVQFWTVWTTGETILIGVDHSYPPDATTAEVHRLESRLVQKFFRLLHQEQLLAE